MTTGILAIAHHLPEEVERLGVRRPIAAEPIGPSVLAVPAARAALERADCAVEDVDFIVFATWTPDVTFPGAGCFFQRELGCGTVGALDVRAQCAGFLFGLGIADQFVRTSTYRRILVVAAEVHSSVLDYSDRGAPLARLFGDGAGVALVGPHDSGESRVLSVVLHSDGSGHRDFWCEYPASRQHPVRITVDDFRAGKHFPAVNLPAVRSFAEACLPTVIGEAEERASLRSRDVDAYFVAHLLPEVAEKASVEAGIDRSRVHVCGSEHGHLSAASLPVALSEAVAAGKVGPGATVCLATAGAGFTWAAAVVRL